MPIAGPFDRPIPGESLTTEPRNNPWEQPPEMADVKDVAMYYLERLNNDDIIDDFAALCQAGVSLAPIVESTYLQGVMRGLHTLDAGLVVAPIIHSFLKQSIEAVGVTVKDTNEDPQAKANEAEKNRFMMLAMKYLEEEGMDESDPGKSMLQEMLEEGQEEDMGTEEPNEVEGPEEEMQEEKPMGLMAKG